MSKETKEECMNTELQPCPFCGGGAELTSRFDVKCTACGAEINSQTPEKDWNRRDGLQSAITAATADLERQLEEAKQPPSLVERCFTEDRAQEELFATIHRIMGGESLQKCNESGFVWKVTDCWCDAYDGSVEILTVEPLTREQADQILALGFGQIYESHNGEGINWTIGSKGKCSPREGEKHAQIRAERDQLRAANAEQAKVIERLREAIRCAWGMLPAEEFRDSLEGPDRVAVEQVEKVLLAALAKEDKQP